MKGRFLGIKKTLWLKIMAVLFFLLFIGLVFLSIINLKIPDLWFYSFCLLLGSFEIFKSKLFKLDSSFYLGILLANIGISGFIFWLTGTKAYAPFYIAFSFVLASIWTAIFCGQRFHLFIAYSTFFVTIFAYLLSKTLITIPIFVAFVLSFLILLILGTIKTIKRRR